MPKFQLLLLDAGIVIELHKFGLWSQILEKCSVHLTEEVIHEVRYWPEVDELEIQQKGKTIKNVIDLDPLIQKGEIKQVDVPLSQTRDFLKQFDPIIWINSMVEKRNHWHFYFILQKNGSFRRAMLPSFAFSVV